uniref:F-box only protein 48 isoform X2 n=1 Tax=Callorhinus ursinus TaxID=34884 RepID=A0A3Q7NRR7_CALUR|nr:F-box only protein 48 isoform X2 [Callorhinus ursinus]
MAKDSNSKGFNSLEELPRHWSLLSYFPKTSRGSSLLSRGIKILTTKANSDHKQPNEWEQLWPWQVQKHRLHMRIIC